MEKVNTKVLLPYFTTLVIITIPFWILGSATHISWLPFNMQLNVLLVLVVPLISTYFIARAYGTASLKQVFRDCLPKRHASSLGLAVAFLTLPLVATLVFTVTQFFISFDGWFVPLYLVPICLIVYYIAAAFEEIGWTWFATPILGRRLNIVGVGVVIGVVWAAMHTLPWFWQNGLWFMAGMILLTVLSRIIMTWLYLKNGRLLWLNVVYHAMINTTFTVFHPGSPYANPLAYAGILLVMVVAIIVFGPGRKKGGFKRYAAG